MHYHLPQKHKRARDENRLIGHSLHCKRNFDSLENNIDSSSIRHRGSTIPWEGFIVQRWRGLSKENLNKTAYASGEWKECSFEDKYLTPSIVRMDEGAGQSKKLQIEV